MVTDRQPGEVDRVAQLLMDAWADAEGVPVGASYTATFADMARAVIADRAGRADAYDRGVAAAHGYDWTDHLDRQEVETEYAEALAANPYRRTGDPT